MIFSFRSLHILGITVVSVMLIYDFYRPVKISVRNPQFTLLGPYETTKPTPQVQVDDVYDQLIDLRSFSFKVNPQPCQNYSAGLLLVIIISSKPSQFENRLVIRNTWGLSVDSTKVVFLLGETENTTINHKIRNEATTFGDVVQGSFIDTYRNLTYKHVMGLKWVFHHCPMAKYVLKTDDDVVINSHALRRFLALELSPWGARDLITCEVFENTPVLRWGKWNVLPAEYGEDYYPPYCVGVFALYSQDVIPRLLKASQSTPFFWIEDVYVTGLLAEQIGVTRTPLGALELLSWERAAKLMSIVEYAGKHLFGPMHISVRNISKIWNFFAQ